MTRTTLAQATSVALQGIRNIYFWKFLTVKMKKLLFSLILCGSVTSCASYQATTFDAGAGDIQVSSQKLETNDIVIDSTVFQDVDTTVKYYSQNLLEKGILPIQLGFTNNDNQSVIQVEPRNFYLTGSDEMRFNSIPVDQVIQRASFSQGQSAAWFIGFGIIGGAISASKVASANKKLSADYNEKALNSLLLQPRESARGTVFFLVDQSIDSLDDIRMAIPLKDSGGLEEEALFSLSGPIEMSTPKKAKKGNSPLGGVAD